MAMRFAQNKEKSSYKKLILSLLAFVLVVVLFCYGADQLSSGTAERQKQSLENAVNRTVTYCYAIEGAYPESVEYMEKNYDLTYDKDKFFVGYETRGANILPDITIIELED